MTGGTTRAEIRRILVALDASRESLAALEAAVELAADLEAELTGLFVEDINIFNLAGLPFAREVGYGTSEGRSLDEETVERQFRVVAGEARRALEKAAGPRRVRWSFRVVRGQVEQELLIAAGESDMVAVGKGGRSLTRGRRLGQAARAVAARGPGAVLITEPGAAPDHCVTVTYDASACAERALEMAGRIAKAGGGTLNVLIIAGDDERARHLESAADKALAGSGVAARFMTLAPGDPEALKRAVSAQGGALFVLGTACYPLPPDELERLLEESGCPVLLIR